MDVFNYAYTLVQAGLLLETNISPIVSIVRAQGKGWLLRHLHVRPPWD